MTIHYMGCQTFKAHALNSGLIFSHESPLLSISHHHITPHVEVQNPNMSNSSLLRRLLLLSPPRTADHCVAKLSPSTFHYHLSHYSASSEKNGTKWFTLPPHTATVDGAVLGKAIAGAKDDDVKVLQASKSAATTALKWVVRCCPELPRSLVQKLFRLRQVRRESFNVEDCNAGDQLGKPRLRRVSAKDSLNLGDKIFLPISVKELPVEKKECFCNEEEVKFIRSLELYKDPAIVVVNKPPGLPVQGGIGIKTSLDQLAVTCLSYDYTEPPRLVHRLDRDCSGILVMGRTQTSATVLHSIFREKTFGASNDETVKGKIVLQRRYWAFVIGSPRHPNGLISAPLRKVVLDNGKSDRITVVNGSHTLSSQHAITKYKVIGSSSHGYTWLELSPLTGRKHQLRVHCAEVLGTPMVGDYKYGWQAHRDWKPLHWPDPDNKCIEVLPKRKNLPFGLNMDNGSISEKHPRLHLHCKQMVLPNISHVLQNVQRYSDYELSRLERLKLDAPLPSYMQRSWHLTNS